VYFKHRKTLGKIYETS